MMSSAPTRPRGYPAGIAYFGSHLAMSLVMAALAVGLLIIFVTRDCSVGILVSTIGLIVLLGGSILYNGVYVVYQARPVPLRFARESLLWQPPPTLRAAIVTSAIGTVISVAGYMTIGPSPLVVLVLSMILLGVCFVSLTIFVRLEADHEGIRCRNPLTTVRLPWSEVESLEPRGSSAFTQRIVAVTRQGRERMLWVFDPRIPHTADAARLLVDELEAVRQSAANADA
jgi:hypothetical protein